MGLYDRLILPKITHYMCGQAPVSKQRKKIVPQAEGRVLEIGVGTGLNLPFYEAQKLRSWCGLDPSKESLAMAQKGAGSLPFEAEFLHAGAEDIPLESDSIDTVVTTYALCSIPRVHEALLEIHRVLTPEGRLLFCEHGLAPDDDVVRWQRRLNPLWGFCGGGCRLDRSIPSLLGNAHFRIKTMGTMYLPGWRFASYNYWGTARPKPL